MMAMGLGLGAGGLWVVWGVGLFLPVFHFVALPHWGRRGHLGLFARGCAAAAAAAVLPGGTMIAAWAVLAEKRRRAGVGTPG